jgi:hypothetical protein
MPKIKYVARKFSAASKDLIDKANVIIAEYEQQGFNLSLRQIYYQFVARDFIPNTMKSYKNLGSVINDARLAGLIDWNAVEDRTRHVVTPNHWDNPTDIVSACAQQFRVDKWKGQKFRPECWVEKQALEGILEGVCRELDISFLACRGYASQSEMWSSAMRFKAFAKKQGQTPIILSFQDHDPSGLDMTRDITDRLELFMGGMKIDRLALNMPQIKQYHPPPNPAKVTDSRFKKYQDEFGDESWELDALEPAVLVALVREAVEDLRDDDLWDEKVKEENHHRAVLAGAAKYWDGVEGYVSKRRKVDGE